jgi:hypothetical protein
LDDRVFVACRDREHPCAPRASGPALEIADPKRRARPAPLPSEAGKRGVDRRAERVLRGRHAGANQVRPSTLA